MRGSLTSRPVALSLAALFAGASLSLAGGGPPSYTARLLTPGLSAVNAAGMNESGDVVGTSTTGTGAWVSRGGAPAGSGEAVHPVTSAARSGTIRAPIVVGAASGRGRAIPAW